MNITPLILDVVVQLVLLPISAAILFGCTRLLKFKDQAYMTALKVCAVSAVFAILVDALSLTLLGSMDLMMLALMALVFIAAAYALSLLLIKFFYKEDWKNTLIAWVVFSIVEFIVAAIIGFVIGIILVAALGVGV